MKFGVLLSAQHLVGEDLFQHARQHAEQVDLIEALGFHSVWVGQHFLSDYQELQPVPTLAWLAARTRRLQIGIGVLLLPLYHPVIVGEELATLDVLSGGRLIAGFGLGYRDEEFDAFRVPRSEAAARLSEGVEVIVRLWTEERITFNGRFYQLQNAYTATKPLQRPRPPVWLAANSDMAVRRAAANADAWLINPHAMLGVLCRQVALYRQEAARNGRPLDRLEVPLMREVYVSHTVSKAIRESYPALAAKYERYVTWGQDRAMRGIDQLARPIENLAHDRFIIGDVQYCIDEIHRYKEALGVTHLIMRVQWPGLDAALATRSIRLIGERVLPALSNL